MKTRYTFCLATLISVSIGTADGGDVIVYDALLRDITLPCGKQVPYSSVDSDLPLSFIGGINVIGKCWDAQSADDFELTAPHTITRITLDRGSWFGSLSPEYRIEFFADAGGVPSETAAVTVFSSSYSDDGMICNTYWGDSTRPDGHRITIELGGGVPLDAGIWWVAVQDINDNDFRGATFMDNIAATTGGQVHYREAGLDHGNGCYPVYYAEPDWVLWGSLVGNYDGVLAMRVEGVPANNCPADLTGDGELDFFDVSAFLSAFTAMDPTADFTGDGAFDFFDVSAFLNAFTAGCP